MFSTASSFARKLSVAIVVALLGGVLAPVATATSASAGQALFSAEGLDYSLDENNNATIWGSSGESNLPNQYVIPSTLDGNPVTAIGQPAFSDTTFTSVTIPASITSFGESAFDSSSALKDFFFLGNAPTSVGTNAFYRIASGAKAHISATATGFGTGPTWNGLIIDRAVPSYTVTYNAANGTAVTSGSFTQGGTIDAAPVSTRAGYTLTGWSATSNGTVVTFPYSPGVNTNISLHAIWSLNNGSFKCATGAPLVGDDTSPTYTITNGVVENGSSCTGVVVIPEGVTSIGFMAFRNSALTSISIPASVTSIGASAFRDSALTSISIPASVTSIGEKAFESATALNDVHFLGNAPASVGTEAFNLVASGAKANISATATGFGTGSTWNDLVIVRATPVLVDGSYVCTTGLLREVSDTSPTYTITNGVVENGGNCSGAVVIPDGVTSIGFGAFASASLTTINIPTSVTIIDDYAFEYASSLASITLPANVTSIGASAFRDSALTSITIPAGVTIIGRNMLRGATALTSITVDPANQSFTSIDGVFFNKNATTLIQYPSGKNQSFYSIPAGVTIIGEGAFRGATALTSVTMQVGVTTIESGAFNNMASLSDITIPEGVTTIGAEAFTGATALTSITIPASVTSIGDFSFDVKTSLKDIFFVGNAPGSVGSGAFPGVASGAKAHISATATGFGTGPTWNGLIIDRAVPSYTVTYNAANGTAVTSGSFTQGGTIDAAPVSTRAGYSLTGWSATSNGTVVTFPYSPGVNTNISLHAIWSLNNGSFLCATGTPLVGDDTSSAYTITNGVVENGSSCTGVVVIPAGVTSIGAYAFMLSSLTSINIPAGVTSIGAYAFDQARELTSITLPAGVTSIGERAFSSTDKLVSANIPVGVTTINNGTFNNAVSLTSIIIPEGVTHIGNSAFAATPALAAISLPSTLTHIGAEAFRYTTALPSITIPAGVISIGANAFCSSSTSDFFFLGDAPSVGSTPFDGNAGAKAHISATATGFGTESTWQGLTIARAVPSYTVTYNAANGTAVTSGSFTQGGTIDAAPVSTRAGYTLTGWSATSNGTVVTFPYSPGVNTNISLHAIWSLNNGSYVCTTGLLREVSDTSPAYTITNGVVDGASCSGTVVIPEGVTSIGFMAFRNSALTSISIPASVTSIGVSAFRNSALTSINIPAGVTSIGEKAFESVTALTSITIPAGVTSIESAAFYGATALNDVHFLGNAPASVGTDAFTRVASGAKANISATATGFGTGSTWNDLVIVRATPVLVDGSYVCTTGLLREVSDTSPTYTITNGVVENGSSCTGVVVIPDGVTSIGDFAFRDATSLTSITIPASVTTIGASAFRNTALTSITIPASVTSIGNNAFNGATSLEDVYFLGDAPTFGTSAFDNIANGAKAHISATATGFGTESTWQGLTIARAVPSYTVTYNAANGTAVTSGSFTQGGTIYAAPVSTRAGYTLTGWSVTANGAVVTFPYSPGVNTNISLHAIWSLNNGSYVCTTGLLREVSDTSPAYTITNGVVTSGASCSGTVVIPEGVTSIGNQAFQYANSLTSITFAQGSQLTSIGAQAFENATALTSITFAQGSQLTSIGAGAFQGARSLTSITIPASVTSIILSAFRNMSALTAITVDPANQSYTSIDGALFNKNATTLIRYPVGKSAASFTIPASVVTISNFAFESATSLVSVIIPPSVASIGESAFKGASALTSITIPSGVGSIANSAFENATSLASVTIPPSVTSIGSNAFKGATALTSITIPPSVTSIGGFAFRDATALKDVYFLGNAPDSVGFWAFNSIANGARAFISAAATGFGTESTWNDLEVLRPYGPGSTSGYVNCMQGSQTTGKIFITENVIVQSVGCSGEVSIPAGVTGIAANAFQNASSLTSIYFLGKAPTTVAANAFAGVSANATAYKTKSVRFKLVAGKWNSLSVENAVVARFFGNGSKVGTVPSQIMRPAGQSFVAPENTGGLGKIGYTFLGWNTLANGRGTSYAPGATVEMRQAGMMLHSTWSQNPTKAETASKPVISGFTISTSNGKNSLGVSSGPWSGFPKPTLSYKWYSCTDKVSYVGSTVPETCSEIASATSSKLALTKRFKGQHIVVSVTGQSAGTSPTIWYSKSSATIR